ncbi:LysR family transcriptional regulator [Methylovirgula sp. 4M-Z18]|uniref:LysR family transcriptional regulator n=1 Tax=Methylovirgula sp. 4M-Z18 TaxID=2293567 RepID=UPI000E2F8206|nr:LysR family transcriptional regulator [Methylovirgula sp. 4M-Z18]RFB79700.1 LysR family transcriptional regulator [Methylovirgula sp. 4M-Z18]
MAQRPALDLELLRTLVCIAEEASFTKAAERVGRTQSAVTLQVQKLEGLVGQSLVVRSKGGPVELTSQGRILVESARSMLKLNDEALRAVSSPDLPATVRLGTSSGYISCYLSDTLERFREAFPNALVEVTEGYSCQLTPHIRDGMFDLVLCQASSKPRNWPSTEIWRGPLRWVTSIEYPVHVQRPLPLCLTPGNCPWQPPWMDDCYWRGATLRALEQTGMPYRIVASAVALEGLYAPVAAGGAVTVTTGRRLPPGLRVVEDGEGLPSLPDDVVIVIKSRSAVQPYTDALTEIIRSTFSFD